ncbi:MAG: tRNA-specific adenosine deaminase, partial [Pseudomonadota bacterium]
MNDVDYMRRAIELARAAGDAGEVPVGAVLVSG